MKLISHLIFLSVFITVTYSSLYTEVKNNVIEFLHRSFSNSKDDDRGFSNYVQDSIVDSDTHKSDIQAAHLKSKLLQAAKLIKKKNKNEVVVAKVNGPNIEKQRYFKDPVLNVLSRKKTFRRAGSSSFSDSSSMEMQNWKDEWKEHWIQKKFEAINSSHPRGDTVNMLGARPWGVPCGDPNQHDAPWGSCMLAMECEAEYRVYRGDYLCGRTMFVCCALQLNNYDMYQGFDVSFEESGLSTDSDEKKNRNIGSKERKKKAKERAKKRRRNERLKRKRKIKRSIRRIIKEIRKILNKSYKNGTSARKRKTRQLKKFIRNLKRQFKKDRNSVKHIHEKELESIDNALMRKLEQIRVMNQNFVKNDTFRDIVVNGTITPKIARMLLKLYPDLAEGPLGPDLKTRRTNNNQQQDDTGPSYYDIEYGPWGVPCGDPNQHDAPWGSCMLAMECEAEYRVYRGDYLCGRTMFVCCALQLNNYDMYQGFDVSFEESGLSTDTEEKRNRNIGSKEKKKKAKERAKKRRRNERLKRKRKIKRSIRRIIKEIRKILNKSYKNGTSARKRKTRQLKKFIRNLKRQFKKDRNSVKHIHEKELESIDNALMRKLEQIRVMNQNFVKNDTFRDIVVNGTITPKIARMLLKLYPDLAEGPLGPDLKTRRSNKKQLKDEELYYDTEYGLIYY